MHRKSLFQYIRKKEPIERTDMNNQKTKKLLNIKSTFQIFRHKWQENNLAF